MITCATHLTIMGPIRYYVENVYLKFNTIQPSIWKKNIGPYIQNSHNVYDVFKITMLMNNNCINERT